ncbi:hypothetical protein SISSUDRAFT_717614 [Sistotremastrum suecicum HHB10207 ss-3]|uniref:Tim44-like domain-containing protein n=1 Tax=Sistotremastrum suecicum HHB10207 ss-3 TaxID=1314776 RepID=A0A165WTT4_9AGAM|nr:hypothetical protein SISSUDRAFT_717614 [Sistotremastrum suecicum HHB10207 ss-3]
MLSHSSKLMRSRARDARDAIHIRSILQSRNAGTTVATRKTETTTDDSIERFEKAVDLVNRGGAKGLPWNEAVDPWMRTLDLFDVSFSKTFKPPRHPPKSADLSVAASLKESYDRIIGNIRHRSNWLRTELSPWMKSCYAMYELASQDGFHKPSKLPAWRSLPDEALSDALLEEWNTYLANNEGASLLNPQSGLLSPGGRFRPLRSRPQYSLDSTSPSPEESTALKTTLLGDPVKVRRIRGIPVDGQMFDFASTKENAWIAGIRWSALEAYLKICYARAKGDRSIIRAYASDPFRSLLLEETRQRKIAANLSSTNSSLGHTYVWKYHGEASPCRVRSLRIRPVHFGRTAPSTGNRLAAHILVSFDTHQSLAVYNAQGRRIDALSTRVGETKRVIENFALEKRMWYNTPWMLKQEMWEGVEAKYRSYDEESL